MITTRLRTILLWDLLLILVVAPFAPLLIRLKEVVLLSAGHPLSPAALTFLGHWKLYFLAIAVILLLVIWLIDRKLPFIWTQLDTFLGIFGLFALVWGGQHAPSLSLALKGAYSSFIPFLYYFLGRTALVNREQFITISRLLVWVAVPVLLFGVVHRFIIPTHVADQLGLTTRAMSTFLSAYSLAVYTGVVGLLLLFTGREWLSKNWWLGLSLLAGLTFVLTFSRGHVVSMLLAGVVVAGFVYFTEPPRVFCDRPNAAAHYLTWLTALLIGFTIWLLCFLQKSATPLASQDLLTWFTHNAAANWSELKAHFAGTGLGSVNVQMTAPFASSWYIAIGQELGWLGLLGVLGMLASLLGTLSRMYRDMADSLDRRLVLFFLTSLVFLLFSVNLLPRWYEVGSLYWWSLFGFFLSDYLVSFPRSTLVAKIHPKARSGKTTVAR